MTYFISNSGTIIDPRKFSAKKVKLWDIAHGLAKICRYGSALPLNKHYSVASHSYNLAIYAKDSGYDVETQRALLMHDAAEAYLGDVVTSIKMLLPCYRSIEARFDSIIRTKYKISCDLDVGHTVKHLDTSILLDEVFCLMPHHLHHFRDQLQGFDMLGITIYYDQDQELVRYKFLDLCEQLGVYDD